MRLLHRDRHRQEEAAEHRQDEATEVTDADLTNVEATTGPSGRGEARIAAEPAAADATMVATPDPSSEHTTQPVAGAAGPGVQPVRIRERSWAFAPGQLVSLVAGAVLVAVGALAVVRAGVGEPLAEPVVEVLGFTHTAWLGLAEIGLGVALMLVGSGTWGKWLSILIGAATVVTGVLVLAEPSGLPDELALERDFGWPLVAMGAVVALAAMVLPVWRVSTTNTRVIDLRADDRRVDPDAPDHDDVLVTDTTAREGDSRHFWSRR